MAVVGRTAAIAARGEDAPLELTPEYIIETLGLEPHPEGGYFKETYRDTATTSSGRSASTTIYYLLKAGQHSSLHRIDASEGWHHYAGGALQIVELEKSGPEVTRLGSNLLDGERPQHVVKARNWFGAKPADGTDWALVGCTVAPAFEFEKFEMGKRKSLMEEYGEKCREWIEELTPEA